LLPAVQAARESGRRTKCKSQLHNIVLALHTYHDTNNRLPPGFVQSALPDVFRHVGFAWGSYILPYLEQQSLRERQLRTRAVTRVTLEIWHCPSDGEIVRRRFACWNDAALGGQNGGECTGFPGSSAFNRDQQGCLSRGGSWRQVWNRPSGSCNVFASMSSYVGNFGSRGSVTVENPTDGGGILFGNSQVTLGQITDGSSYTWAVGERFNLLGHAAWEAVHWERRASQPDRFTQGTLSEFQTGRFVLGTTGAGLPNASGSHGFSAGHREGIHMALCDASVRFVPRTIDRTAWNRLGGRNDGLPVGHNY
jgi:hypothetical protein